MFRHWCLVSFVPIYDSHFEVVNPGQPSQQQYSHPAALRVSGPVVAVEVEVPATLPQAGQVIPAPESGFALIDTGASISAVAEGPVGRLGVQPVGVVNIAGVTGANQQPTYPCRFTFSGTGLPSIDFGSIVAAPLSSVHNQGMLDSLIALIGRDILEHFALIYNGPDASFSLPI